MGAVRQGHASKSLRSLKGTSFDSMWFTIPDEYNIFLSNKLKKDFFNQDGFEKYNFNEINSAS